MEDEMKRLKAKILVCAMLLLIMTATPVYAAITTNLKDVDVNDPASEKIVWAINQGYMKPVLGRFYPKKEVKRGELAMILSKITGDISSLKNPTKATFTDTLKTYQYFRHIETMKGYINYYKNSEGKKIFKPTSNITREDAAKAVVKILGFDTDEALMDSVESDISVEEIIADFSKISPSNKKYVEIVIVNELMDYRLDDEGNVYFDPKKSLTRGDLANLIWNAEQQKNYLKSEDTENEETDVNTDENEEISSEDSDIDISTENETQYSWSRDIEVKFVNNADYIGNWNCVAFVKDIESFTPGMTQNFGLFFNKLELLNKGLTSMSWLKWTDGRILNIGGDQTNGTLLVKTIDGEKYLFFQWINGDVFNRGVEPSWYVFEAVN